MPITALAQYAFYAQMSNKEIDMGAVCDGCGKAAMYTIKIGKTVACEECIDKAKDQVAFETWMDQVDQYVKGTVGIGASDLPDFNYRDWYDSGEHPEDTAYYASHAER